MSKVLLINDGKADFNDKCNGKKVFIPAGKAVKVEDVVAYHFIGDPAVLNGEDDVAAEQERIRISMRYGAFNSKDKNDMAKIPKLRIEEIEEEELEILDAPVAVPVEKAQGEEFPDLKKRR